MRSLAAEAGYSKPKIRAGRGGLRQKGETQRKTPSFVASLAHFESFVDLLVGDGGGVCVVAVEVEGAAVEVDSGIPPKLVNLARAAVTA